MRDERTQELLVALIRAGKLETPEHIVEAYTKLNDLLWKADHPVSASAKSEPGKKAS